MRLPTEQLLVRNNQAYGYSFGENTQYTEHSKMPKLGRANFVHSLSSTSMRFYTRPYQMQQSSQYAVVIDSILTDWYNCLIETKLLRTATRYAYRTSRNHSIVNKHDRIISKS